MQIEKIENLILGWKLLQVFQAVWIVHFWPWSQDNVYCHCWIKHKMFNLILSSYSQAKLIAKVEPYVSWPCGAKKMFWSIDLRLFIYLFIYDLKYQNEQSNNQVPFRDKLL